jgi:hypothetical protein
MADLNTAYQKLLVEITISAKQIKENKERRKIFLESFRFNQNIFV